MAGTLTARRRRSGARHVEREPADREADTGEAVEGPRLRPALFAGFGDLTRVRHDFPLVLVEGAGEGASLTTLSGLVDALLGQIAPAGGAGERLRRNVLRLEREIRGDAATSGGGPLQAAWDAAARRLSDAGDEALATDLARAREAMPLAGELVECDAALPARFVTHAWREVQARRAGEVLATIEALESRLAGLVRADLLRSAAGRKAAQLRAGVGTAQQGLFDFEAMARLLAPPSGARALSEARQRRIAGVLDVLRGQRFFGADGAGNSVLGSTDAALTAYRARLPEMADLLRALAIAELESSGRVVEASDEERLSAVDPAGLGSGVVGLFPDYLVCIGPGADDATLAGVLGALGSDAPLKVVVAIDDPFGFGGRLAGAAMDLGDVFVLQTTASHLYAARERVRSALEYRGPALLSIYAGPSGLPGYLVSAAALESRTMPAFAYDPSAGPGWAQRFSLHPNPQAERAWPRHRLTHADRSMHRVSEEVAFTSADLALCDPRWSPHLARPTADQVQAGLVPIDAWLADADHGAPGSAPFVYAIDGQPGTLEKLVVDERLARATRERAEAWSRLRELDSLKVDRGAVESEPPIAATPIPAEAAPPQVAESSASPEVQVEATIPAPGGDGPYIETPRCTTCNECTAVNSRMFAYDQNRQAFIADPGAGTFRDLVEAAERCQVAIIHPGKPRNPNEPGLAELLERAALFA